MEVQIEIRQVWSSLVLFCIAYYISGYIFLPFMFFLLTWGLLEEIEDFEQEEDEESDGMILVLFKILFMIIN